MFAKIHASIFDSSINDADPITRFVFVAMVVLSDRHGRLDITPASLARRINLDRAEVERSIETLCAPDPMSRTPECEGRRIIPLDPRRSWGWIVVNKEQYRDGPPDPDAAAAATRERVRRYRAKEKNQKKTDADADTDTASVTCNAGNADVTRVTQETLQAWFEGAWGEYPRREGKRDAWRHYRASIATTDDRDRLLVHLGNYKARLAAEKTERRFIQRGGRWFANWTDEEYAGAPQPAAMPGFTV